MFDNKTRIPLYIGLVLIVLVATIGWLLPEHGPLMLLGGVFIFFVLLIVLQTYYAIRLFKQDRVDREKNTTPCDACDAPLYPEDTTCPYCKTPRENTKNDEEAS